MAKYEIFLPRTLNNEYPILLELYQQIENILPVLEEKDSVVFNFGNIRWINAEMTVFLGMIFSEVNARGAIVYALLDNLSLKSKEILLKNGFLKHFGLEYDLDDTYNTTIPFFRRNIKNIEEIDEYIDDELLSQIRTKTSEDFLCEIKEALL